MAAVLKLNYVHCVSQNNLIQNILLKKCLLCRIYSKNTSKILLLNSDMKQGIHEPGTRDLGYILVCAPFRNYQEHILNNKSSGRILGIGPPLVEHFFLNVCLFREKMNIQPIFLINFLDLPSIQLLIGQRRITVFVIT